MSQWTWNDLGQERGRYAMELTDGDRALVYHDAFWKPKKKAKLLIAAAPDLFAGLKHVGYEGHRFGSVQSEGCEQCRLALDALRAAAGGK